jgi:hypothetical protein
MSDEDLEEILSLIKKWEKKNNVQCSMVNVQWNI